MSDEVRGFIQHRANRCCEYCHLPDIYDQFQPTIDHIRALVHGGSSDLDNLCFACSACNTFKGTNASGYDPLSAQITRLFNPRSDDWQEHFHLDRKTGQITGLTEIGRTTVFVLRFNRILLCEARVTLLTEGKWPL